MVSIKRKAYSFNCSKSSSPRVKLKINRQPTLIGAFFNLMMSQNMIIALVRVKGNHDKPDNKTIPIVFKAEKTMIPDEIKSMMFTRSNFVEVKIPGIDSFPALVIVLAEDSQDLKELYNSFCAKDVMNKLENVEKKLLHWFTIDGIKLKSFSAQFLPSIKSEEFDRVVNHVKSLEKDRFQKVKSSEASTSETIRKNAKATDDDRIKNKKKNESQKYDFKPLMASIEKLNLPSVKNFANEVLKILSKITNTQIETVSTSQTPRVISSEFPKPLETSKSHDFALIRIIPEGNKTSESGTMTLIEGVLPVNTRSYKQATRSRLMQSKLDPYKVINTLVKYTFPKHWVVGTTLRGSGGKISLVSLWNYQNPNVSPCEGAFEDGLGEARLRGFLDHVIRLMGQKSYDIIIQKFMVNCMAKAIVNKRKTYVSKSTPRKKSILDDCTDDEEFSEDEIFLNSDEEADVEDDVEAEVEDVEGDDAEGDAAEEDEEIAALAARDQQNIFDNDEDPMIFMMNDQTEEDNDLFSEKDIQKETDVPLHNDPDDEQVQEKDRPVSNMTQIEEQFHEKETLYKKKDTIPHGNVTKPIIGQLSYQKTKDKQKQKEVKDRVQKDDESTISSLYQFEDDIFSDDLTEADNCDNGSTSKNISDAGKAQDLSKSQSMQDISGKRSAENEQNNYKKIRYDCAGTSSAQQSQISYHVVSDDSQNSKAGMVSPRQISIDVIPMTQEIPDAFSSTDQILKILEQNEDSEEAKAILRNPHGKNLIAKLFNAFSSKK